MTRRGIADIKSRLAYAEFADVLDSLSKEKIQLAEFIDRNTDLDFDQAWHQIETMCTELLPGYRGMGKLMVFRNEIRDKLKKPILERMAYEKWLKEQVK